MTCAPRKQSKTYKVPKRPYEAARLDAELKVGYISKEDLGHGRVGWTYSDLERLYGGIGKGQDCGCRLEI
jgi:hypothetical protein